MKGTKRFKNKGVNGGSLGDADLMLGEGGQKTNIKEYFRKMMNQTSYCQTFGEKPKAAEAYSILKQKKFSELQMNEILQPEIVRILTKWLLINDQDMFTGRIYFTIREMYTVIKAQISTIPTSHEAYLEGKKSKEAEPQRFDKILQNLNAVQRKRNSMSVTKAFPSQVE